MKNLFSFAILLPQVQIHVAHSFAFVHVHPTVSSTSTSTSTCLFETSSADAAAQDAVIAATITEPETSSAITIDTDEDAETDTNVETETSGRITVPFPVIHWTVPNYKVGYRDDDGNWYDVDGPRNGPPQNYWRQMADEREYDRDINALINVLSEFDVQSNIQSLEKRRSTRKPSLSRKILGTWAPIIMNGSNVSFRSDMNQPLNDEKLRVVDVPYLIEISRSDGRRLGPKNHYGVFDLKLEHGENLTVKLVSSDERMDLDAEFHAVVDEENRVNVLGVIPTPSTSTVEEQQQDEEMNDVVDSIVNTQSTPLSIGSVTYITDYVMVQRNEDGAIDFWLRADDSYLGVKEE